MHNLYLFLALSLAACSSNETSASESVALQANTSTGSAAYQSVKMGEPRDTTLPWEVVSNEGEVQVYQLPNDSLAFGVVPALSILYTFRNDRAEIVDINVEQQYNSQLRVCLESVYGKPIQSSILQAEWHVLGANILYTVSVGEPTNAMIMSSVM